MRLGCLETSIGVPPKVLDQILRLDYWLFEALLVGCDIKLWKDPGYPLFTKL